jgi:glyoxylase-like metal-dependent hydrolase (beta-lactamase superfamily II)
MHRTLRPTLIALSLAVLISGCSQQQPAATATPEATPAVATTPAPATPAPADSADIHRFRIGTLDAVALKDGDIEVPNDNKTFGVGEPVADSNALLAAAGAPTDVLHLSIQPLLVRAGERVLLFDTGAAGTDFGDVGKLQASLRAAGVAPGQVTDIFISHTHDDHLGGLRDAQGALAFPNATIHLAAAAWAALQEKKEAAEMVAAITPKVQAFAPGAALVPGVVTAVDLPGHTPGHTGYDIASGDAHLLYIGDAMHHYVLSVQRPDWTLAWDADAATAKATRRALLERAAADRLRLYAGHFPFPGLGQVQAQGDGFAWVPER